VNLIGRRSELAVIERLLGRSGAGVGGSLMVTGPAGAGKTALADAAADLAAARGMPVLRATARAVCRFQAR
jgi:ribose 1,5-bisphosphokinase PhnN